MREQIKSQINKTRWPFLAFLCFMAFIASVGIFLCQYSSLQKELLITTQYLERSFSELQEQEIKISELEQQIQDSKKNLESDAKDFEIPPEYTSGNSRYSQGICEEDSECYIGGCSGEVCASKPGVITTCEVLPDFPDKTVYKCGCVNNICGWTPLEN